MRKFEVIEDNGGGLTLAIFNAEGKVDYIHSGYEYSQGQLQNDLDALKSGDNPVEDWDGNCGGLEWEYGNDPQVIYDSITSYEYGWEIVADSDGIYPDKMGTAARLELVPSVECSEKDFFESMINDFMFDHPEYSDLLLSAAEKNESGIWIAYAEDDKCTYILYDYGDGNILLDYIGTK